MCKYYHCVTFIPSSPLIPSISVCHSWKFFTYLLQPTEYIYDCKYVLMTIVDHLGFDIQWMWEWIQRKLIIPLPEVIECL